MILKHRSVGLPKPTDPRRVLSALRVEAALGITALGITMIATITTMVVAITVTATDRLA